MCIFSISFLDERAGRIKLSGRFLTRRTNKVEGCFNLRDKVREHKYKFEAIKGKMLEHEGIHHRHLLSKHHHLLLSLKQKHLLLHLLLDQDLSAHCWIAPEW